jgi:hypothetical protein
MKIYIAIAALLLSFNASAESLTLGGHCSYERFPSSTLIRCDSATGNTRYYFNAKDLEQCAAAVKDTHGMSHLDITRAAISICENTHVAKIEKAN